MVSVAGFLVSTLVGVVLTGYVAWRGGELPESLAGPVLLWILGGASLLGAAGATAVVWLTLRWQNLF